jgi:hypothetical protein
VLRLECTVLQVNLSDLDRICETEHTIYRGNESKIHAALGSIQNIGEDMVALKMGMTSFL